jgi:hypothetical protein
MNRAVAVVIFVAACNQNSGTHALYQPGASDFYSTPYPNNLYRNADGTLDLSAFPTNSPLVDQYRMAAQALDGFSLNAPIFVRFDDALDPASLPDPPTSEQAGASVYLVNVDTSSPNVGKRTPIIATFRPDGTNTIKGNRLSVRPYPGFTLDEGTTYALVVTDRVHDAGGEPVKPSSLFKSVIGGGGSSTERAVYAPLLAFLDGPNGEARANVIDATVFTTQHATFVGPALRKGVFGTPAPTTDVPLATTSATYVLWTGNYMQPNFQTGSVPYLAGGGEIQYDATNTAIVQRMEPMRYALMIPLGAPPTNGWPICIYQHGTGGDYMDFVRDGTGGRLAAQGIATISTDQVLHGPRNPGGDPEVDFFDFGNPYAARDNALQGAADAWSQMRLAFGLNFADGMGHNVFVDQSKLMFFGHSQGGLTGPPFIAWEPAVKGAVLSGTGGVSYLGVLYKLNPVSFKPLLESLGRDLPMDEDNPTLGLAQMWLDRADTVNNARFMVREPQTTGGPRNIFQSEGFIDTIAPNKGIEAFATAIGGDIAMEPAQMDVFGLTTLRGRTVMTPPFSNNLNGATAVLAQYPMHGSSDGHFVVFDVPTAEAQAAQFLGTLAATGVASVVTQ